MLTQAHRYIQQEGKTIEREGKCLEKRVVPINKANNYFIQLLKSSKRETRKIKCCR